MRRCIFVLLLIAGLWLTVTESFSAHPFNVVLKDSNGNTILPGTNIPYSPKTTCGTGQCHDTIALRYGINNIYEHGVLSVQKDHGSGSPSYGNPYEVLYPEHGVSAGFHFQQGRSSPWDDTQRSYYGLASFTSSPGMYGKY